jgi:hypothetical protein
MTKVVRTFFVYDGHVRRAMRIARKTLMVFSLLVYLAAGGMWVRSYWAYEAYGRWFAKTDAVEQIFADGRRYREEKRSVRQFRGVESIKGGLGIGLQKLELVKTSPAILAVQWEPVPDADELRHFRYQAASSHVPVPFADVASDFRGWLGFGVVERSGVLTIKAVVIPYWFVMVCAGPWPAVCIARWWQRWRWRRTGKCVACGYDLRGGGERCPECGNVAALSAPQ